MFLTRAEFHPPRAEAAAAFRRDAADLGHRRVWELFAAPSADGEARPPRPFLYRATERGRYLILSTRPPEAAPHWTLEVADHQAAFAAGQRLRFRLRANPARTLPRGAGAEAGKHVDAVMHAKTAAKAAGEPFGQEEAEAAALGWLHAREARLGLRFDREACMMLEYRQHHAFYKDRARPIRFSSADYQGAAEVADPAALAAALAAGVGRARGFGCGLLLLRPA